MRATANTSPLWCPPATISRSVSARILTHASATAARAVSGLAPISTMRASPASFMWVNPELMSATIRFACCSLAGSGRHRDGTLP